MNYKKHNYTINWQASRNKDDYSLNSIQILVTRDGDFPFGVVVTDRLELNYVFEQYNFDINSLEAVEGKPGLFFIKQGSIEWKNYEADPGIPYDTYLKELFKQYAEEWSKNIKEELGADVTINFFSTAGGGFRIYD